LCFELSTTSEKLRTVSTDTREMRPQPRQHSAEVGPHRQPVPDQVQLVARPTSSSNGACDGDLGSSARRSSSYAFIHCSSPLRTYPNPMNISRRQSFANCAASSSTLCALASTVTSSKIPWCQSNTAQPTSNVKCVMLSSSRAIERLKTLQLRCEIIPALCLPRWAIRNALVRVSINLWQEWE
jgi:hypothetical protein